MNEQPATFQELKTQLDTMHAARRAGATAAATDAEVRALAQAVTDAYNAEARRIAKAHGRRPVLATVKRFLLG